MNQNLRFIQIAISESENDVTMLGLDAFGQVWRYEVKRVTNPNYLHDATGEKEKEMFITVEGWRALSMVPLKEKAA